MPGADSINSFNPSHEEKLEVIKALLNRKNVRSDGLEAFECAYPDAPLSMLEAATFHIYVDGIDAVFDWLLEIERFLRDPSSTIDYGKTSHLIYHLYNWIQLQTIIPEGKRGILEKVSDLKDALEDDDFEAVREITFDLESILSGDLNPPNFE